jgi:hypothetical protein
MFSTCSVCDDLCGLSMANHNAALDTVLSALSQRLFNVRMIPR